MARMRKRGRQWTSSKGTFDPEDQRRVKHTQIGVWDLYEEVQPELQHVPGATKLEQLHDIKQSLPYIWRMLKDIGSLKACWGLLVMYGIVTATISLLPAVGLWYSGQLLKIVEAALETRTVDAKLLIRVASGRMFVAVAKRGLQHAKSRIMDPLDRRIKAHYAAHIFEAYVRLDVPTFEDPVVRRQIDSTLNSRTSVAWDTVQLIANTASTMLLLVSQISVLAGVLRYQKDGALIASLSFFPSLLQWMQMSQYGSHGVWAATCKSDDYVRMQGMKHTVGESAHRKEIVAGNLGKRLIAEFLSSQQKVGDQGGDFFDLRRRHQFRDRLTSISLFSGPLKEIPQIVFTLRAVQHPASIPISLASLNLIQQTVSSFSYTIFEFFDQFGSVADQLEAIRKLYEIKNIRNRVIDGTVPYPEDKEKIRTGISIEFANVSFTYAGSDFKALDDVSFKIEAGQLCVIVGVNGSGKSTILKLLTRIYDPSDGVILVDGKDIKSLRLEDLRRTISVLFQDYTHFPLSIRENIGIGNPDEPYDDDKIEQAAKLGGAYDFINKLPDGLDTYLDRPVADHYSGLPEGTKMLFGRKVDHSRVRRMGGMSVAESSGLSGGQMQRLALSRTFMKQLGENDDVGLLLFDEPSASLDPQAEHDLFERLRALRGNKTMLFSSHRFGNLTRYADVILFMRDSCVEEMGTHEELLKRGGGYANIYTLQAQAFL